MTAPAEWPVWLVVASCGVFAQSMKVVLYSVIGKRLALDAVAQSNGLPSLPATLLACLLVQTVVRDGWQSSATSFALVFAVIVVHDTVKLSGMADRQRATLVHLLEKVAGPGPVRRGFAAALDPRAHHPAHVAAGLLLGALFGLAFVSGGR
jgi:acid phosphatase family membrane protein YuiD